jgi:hypothetical protein
MPLGSTEVRTGSTMLWPEPVAAGACGRTTRARSTGEEAWAEVGRAGEHTPALRATPLERGAWRTVHARGLAVFSASSGFGRPGRLGASAPTVATGGVDAQRDLRVHLKGW